MTARMRIGLPRIGLAGVRLPVLLTWLRLTKKSLARLRLAWLRLAQVVRIPRIVRLVLPTSWVLRILDVPPILGNEPLLHRESRVL